MASTSKKGGKKVRNNLITRRKAKGLSQEQMAQKIGCERSTYSGYELGYFNPSMEKALKIKEVLGYTKDDIFSNENVS